MRRRHARTRPRAAPRQLLGWVLGSPFAYATLFGVGSVLYGLTTQAIVWGVVWVASGAGLLRILNTLWRS